VCHWGTTVEGTDEGDSWLRVKVRALRAPQRGIESVSSDGCLQI
jgi:hypothetical protein